MYSSVEVGNPLLFNLNSTVSLISEYTTANIGTPTIIPTKPNNFENIKSENSIQNADIPIESPSIFGPIIFPSIH